MGDGFYKHNVRTELLSRFSQIEVLMRECFELLSEPQEKDRVLTCTQAAAYIGCTVQSISNYIRRGWLRKGHDGIAGGIWLSEIDAFIATRGLRKISKPGRRTGEVPKRKVKLSLDRKRNKRISEKNKQKKKNNAKL